MQVIDGTYLPNVLSDEQKCDLALKIAFNAIHARSGVISNNISDYYIESPYNNWDESQLSIEAPKLFSTSKNTETLKSCSKDTEMFQVD